MRLAEPPAGLAPNFDQREINTIKNHGAIFELQCVGLGNEQEPLRSTPSKDLPLACAVWWSLGHEHPPRLHLLLVSPPTSWEGRGTHRQ